MMEYETNPGGSAGPGASETFLKQARLNLKAFVFLLLDFPFGPEVCQYPGRIGCSTRSDQDNKVETVF